MSDTMKLPEKRLTETYPMNADESIIGHVSYFPSGRVQSREYRTKSENQMYYTHGVAFHYGHSGREQKTYHDHGTQIKKWEWWWNTNKNDLQNFRFAKVASTLFAKNQNDFGPYDPRYDDPLRITLSCAIGNLCHKLEKKPSFMDRLLGKQKIKIIRMD